MVQAKFVEGNLFRHVAVMSLTSSVGLMAIFVVDLINMVYISWLQDEVKTAAIGYAGAVLFFTTAFGIGLSVGVSALVSRAVGARDMDLARSRTTEGLLLGAGFAVILFVRTNMRAVLVPTIVAGLNVDQLGPIFRFALEHSQHVTGISVQPMAATGSTRATTR